MPDTGSVFKKEKKQKLSASSSSDAPKVEKHKGSKEKKDKKDKKRKDKKEKSADKDAEKKNRKRSSESNDTPDSSNDKPMEKLSKKIKPNHDKSVPAPNQTSSAVTAAVAQEFYEKHNICVTSEDAFLPFLEFSQTPFSSSILKACKSFSKPTPIQSACWPVITADRDVIGIAETGSGKTFAFALPAIHFLSNKYGERASKCDKPPVLIVSPTRELAIQTHEQCLEAGKGLGITSVCLFGGSSKGAQIGELKKKKPAIIVATPGRLLDLVENDQALDLSEVSFLVLDEADRMLDQGFEKDITTIIEMLGQGLNRQTVMFSATWPKSVRNLADRFLNSPVKVSIGSDEIAINERVQQIVEVVGGWEKNRKLTDLLQKYHKSRKNRVLVFALYKKEASRIEGMLKDKGYNCTSIHGDKAQNQRLDAIEAFRNGSIPLLIATDVAARGLDIPDVEYVINYTFPLTIDDYTHRCGRTARAGKKGVAHTFFTEEDKKHSGELINMLRSANMTVPDNLLKFGTTVKKKEHSSYGAFFKEIDPNARPVKIIFD
ncbi:RNA-dependent ATPase [Coemansia spiralis]|uniref:RNA helicase n=2 Tax=Coemansia TaxID=4863 RepID=A0A9W8KY18_9FUNG|nr:P-loop containing nucleoside triphosphate hydrolase protein [Coemansia spiralis]KAJ1991519.1 RNA-dependent ATPase [Coemansia umbellata]KAJ2621527.1 RNA-dependent ATPase [Coemansia sp. RSA 1358]KAJ2676749.1 RNA-dependent ATPase [Coemansia spiralis]